jgi:DNA-binding transcriptional ArsR family regulator
MSSDASTCLVSWDWGTAYDLFVSLRVLHEPHKFDLRASWAAGVRSRLSARDRETFESAKEVFHFPLQWIYSLPSPKDAHTALQILEKLSPADRLAALAISHDIPGELVELLQNIAARRSWNEKDRNLLRALHPAKTPPKAKTLSTILEAWANPDEFGEAYLHALSAYQEAFFSEEEQRIRSSLQDTLAMAQEKARLLLPGELIEELSQGVRFASLNEIKQIVLSPSYWITPLIVFEKIDLGCVLMLFGARPADFSLVPGEAVPDAMLRSLKALADPTRLKILRYLGEGSYTPTQLARLLRLRAPTVIHHLNDLRLAGLVHLTLEGGGEKRYEARLETVIGTFATLKGFLDLRSKANHYN